MSKKPNMARLRRTPEGEPIADLFDTGGYFLSRTIGTGEMARSIIPGEEIIPGKRVVVTVAGSEEARRKVDEEMKLAGGIKVGKDSPSLGKSVSGHPGKNSRWDKKYGDIFGHEEPEI